MTRRSIVVKLWAVFTILQLAVILPLTLAVSRLFVGFYRDQALAPLVQHAHSIAELMIDYPDLSGQVPLMATMVSAEVTVIEAYATSAELPRLGSVTLPAEFGNRIEQGEDAAFELRAGNDFYLAAAVPLTRDGDDQAVLLVSPAEPVRRVLAAAQWLLWSGVGGMIIFSSLLGWFVSRRLTRPLVQMEEATHRLASGDYAVKVEGSSDDEVGLLGRAINALAEKLDHFERSRRQFLANVAHELRTPLSYIRGYSQALVEGVSGDPAESIRYQSIIHEESLRLGRLVDDLMELAAADEGALPLQRQAADPIELLQNSIAPLSLRTQEQKIAIFIGGRDDLPPVWADPGRIAQVLYNLLDNAVRHTPPGGTIRLEAVVVASHIRFSVLNSGPHIPSEHLPQLFERFQKGGASSGRGLGLAIARSIVRLHGGRIGVSNENGGGVRFWFTLPVSTTA